METTDVNEAKLRSSKFYGLYYVKHTNIALLRYYILSDIETFNEDTGSVGTLQEPYAARVNPMQMGKWF